MQIQLARASDPLGDLPLPWSQPLADWPADFTVDAPSGLHRNVVRFIRHAGSVVAVKEMIEPVAVREYELLLALARLGLAVVRALALVTERDELERASRRALLLTRYLPRAMPFRMVMAGGSSLSYAELLLDALAELLVQLHMAGFFWGDCSLSNVLFRRDAGQFSAYLVDAETGEMHPALSDGARRHDLDITFENVAGEFMDLEAGGKLTAGLEPVALSERVQRRYRELWAELTRVEAFSADETYRIDLRVRRLNEIGFDVKKLEVRPDGAGHSMIVRPQVVAPGHHRRRLYRLTGLNAEENQARRLLNDLDRYRACRRHESTGEFPEVRVGREWLETVYQPTLEQVPEAERLKLDDAEIFHQILEHRWYLSERAGCDLPMSDVVAAYVHDILGPLEPPVGASV